MNPKARHFGAEEVDLRDVQFTAELLASVPAQVARQYQVLPIYRSPHTLKLRVAIADPSDLDAIEAVVHVLHGDDIELYVAEERQLGEFIEKLYGSQGSI